MRGRRRDLWIAIIGGLISVYAARAVDHLWPIAYAQIMSGYQSADTLARLVAILSLLLLALGLRWGAEPARRSSQRYNPVRHAYYAFASLYFVFFGGITEAWLDFIDDHRGRFGVEQRGTTKPGLRGIPARLRPR